MSKPRAGSGLALSVSGHLTPGCGLFLFLTIKNFKFLKKQKLLESVDSFNAGTCTCSYSL